MKRSPRTRKTPVNLSESISRQLNMYAIAAGAAGVGILALAQPAEAKIVYTPANIRIPHNGVIYLDLNHDGISDFSAWSYSQNVRTFTAFTILGVQPQNRNNEIWGMQSVGIWWAAALRKNVQIGSNSAFKQASYLYMAYVGREHGHLSGHGPWIGNKRTYLGLKFKIDGKTHYGWARFHVLAPRTSPVTARLIVATLTGYAYETIPGKAIIAGKTKGPDVTTVDPASLGHLAAGASAIPVWRVNRTAATPH
jgi:hypothetical protein